MPAPQLEGSSQIVGKTVTYARTCADQVTADTSYLSPLCSKCHVWVNLEPFGLRNLYRKKKKMTV